MHGEVLLAQVWSNIISTGMEPYIFAGMDQNHIQRNGAVSHTQQRSRTTSMCREPYHIHKNGAVSYPQKRSRIISTITEPYHIRRNESSSHPEQSFPSNSSLATQGQSNTHQPGPRRIEVTGERRARGECPLISQKDTKEV